MPTVTVVFVIPVWSLNALDGILRLPDVDELAPVGLVEPHAVNTAAINTAIPDIAVRIFHEVVLNAPPYKFMLHLLSLALLLQLLLQFTEFALKTGACSIDSR